MATEQATHPQTASWAFRPRTRQGTGGAERLAKGLGWFSIGLGAAEILFPRTMGKVAGARRPSRLLIMACGAREVASGIGILTQRRPAAWLWGRVAGDAMDLATLAVTLFEPKARRDRTAGCIAAVAGVTALDVRCAMQMSGKGAGPVRVEQTIAIGRSPEELYRFWRDFQNLPRFMEHLEDVRVSGDVRSHCVAKGPAGTHVEWDAEITEDRPGQSISWRSVENADIENSGTVRFMPAPGGRGSFVRVELEYNPPGGALAATAAMLFGEEPGQQVKGDLRRFKQIMETGEIATTAGQPSGRRSMLVRALGKAPEREGGR